MPFSPQTLEEKPYNLCLNCAHIGKRCDGPNFLAMDTDRLCEWCRLRKNYLKWSNAYIADQAGIAKVSVERIMAGETKDLRISTLRAVLKVLVNGTWGQYPCTMASADLENLTQEHRADLVAAHAADQRKIDHLLQEVEFLKQQLNEKDKVINDLCNILKK